MERREILIMEYGKKFIILGSENAISYKEVFRFIKANQIWLGTKPVTDFIKPNGDISCVNTNWFTNLDHNKRHTRLDLYKKYSNEYYPHYENYNAIEVGKVAEIPYDYDGVMGVPISILDKYNPEQFEIVGMCENEDLYGLKTKRYTSQECKDAYFAKFGRPGVYDLNARGVIKVNGLLEKKYARILIRNKQVGQKGGAI